MRKSKAANNAYMRNYRKTKPELTPGQRILREAWAASLEDFRVFHLPPIGVSFDGRQLTACFPGAFFHALLNSIGLSADRLEVDVRVALPWPLGR